MELGGEALLVLLQQQDLSGFAALVFGQLRIQALQGLYLGPQGRVGLLQLGHFPLAHRSNSAAGDCHSRGRRVGKQSIEPCNLCLHPIDFIEERGPLNIPRLIFLLQRGDVALEQFVLLLDCFHLIIIKMNSWIEKQIIFPKIDEHYRHQQRVKEVDDIRTSIIKELRRKKNSSLYNLKGEGDEQVGRDRTAHKGKNTAKQRKKKAVSYFRDDGSQSVEDISGKGVKFINITEVL